MLTHNATSHYKRRLKVGDEKKYIYDPTIYHLLKYINDKKCLDIGCGSGYFLEKMGSGSVGYDASEINVEYGRNNGLDIKLVNIDNWEGEHQHYDVIFASHIIEHLLSPVCFIEKVRKSLSKGKIFIVGVPTEITIDRVKWGYGFNDDIRHFYSFSPGNLKFLIERARFEIIDRYVSYTLMGTIKSKLLENILQNIVPFKVGVLFSKGYYYVCKAI